MNGKHNNTAKKRYKLKTILVCLILLPITVVGYYGVQIFNALQESHKQLDKSVFRTEDIDMAKQPTSLLLTGIDMTQGEPETNWRPDSLILLTLNPNQKNIKIVNIPRDTLTKIANTNINDKLNHAAAYARKLDLDPDQNVKETVEQLLNIPIDHYVRINFAGFASIINALGGIDVNIPTKFSQRLIDGRKVTFTPGPRHLTGEEALAYVRMRYEDPRGDAGRNERQREVLLKIFEQCMQAQNISNLTQMLEALKTNIRYDVPPSKLPVLLSTYKACKAGGVDSFRIRTTGTKINNIWYEILSNAEKGRISKLLQNHLEYNT